MTPLLSDARLVRQAGDGDQRAFAAIYRRYHQDIYRFCLSILGRSEDAQDALQNTMVKALRALPGEEREIQLKPWLYRVAHNESIDLLRRRREGPELESVPLSTGAEVAETVAMRERLGRLLADLGDLPERQRSALLMRELAGLGYEQIGEAFETSPAVARQAVYEARLSLHELEAGREMSCDEVTRQLSEADGRVMRRRDLRAHLRSCPDCRAFRDSIDSRRRDLSALSPLPAAAAASILHGIVGAGGSQVAAGGLGGAAAGAGAGKIAGSSVVVKAVATVAIAATVGVTAADRSGLVDVGLPGDRESGGAKSSGSSGEAHQPTPSSSTTSHGNGNPQGGHAPGKTHPGDRGQSSTKPETTSPAPGASSNPTSPAAEGGAPSNSPPEASSHGRETSAAHKAGGTENPGQARGHEATKPGKAKGREASKPGQGKGRESSQGQAGGHESSAKGKSAQKEAGPQQPAPEAQAKSDASASPQHAQGKDRQSEASS